MWKTSLTLVLYKFGNFSKRFCEFFLTNKILYKNFLYKLEKLHVLWRYFLSKLSAFHKTYPIGFGIGIGRYQKKLSVSVSVSAEKKIENIGDYRYRPKWKKAFRSYPIPGYVIFISGNPNVWRGMLCGGKNSLYVNMKYSHDRFTWILLSCTTMQNAYLKGIALPWK